jgi:hypothetical protein
MKLSTPAPSALKMPYPHLTPDPNDPNLYCNACDKYFTDRYNFHTHIQVIHEMILRNNNGHYQQHDISRKPSSVEKDPSNYCRKCGKRFSSLDNYRKHVDNTHRFLKKKKFNNRAAAEANKKVVLPNNNDPNYFCGQCKINLSSQQSYNYHFEIDHRKMNLTTTESNKGTKKFFFINEPSFINEPLTTTTTMKNSNIAATINNDDVENYCGACKRHYLDQKSFREHPELAHGMNLKATPHSPPITPPPQQKPSANSTVLSLADINSGPYVHCESSKKTTYRKEQGYRSPAKVSHRMKIAPTEPEETMASILAQYKIPNPKNPNFYCCSCRATFDTKDVYHHHLESVHKVSIEMILSYDKKTGSRSRVRLDRF